MVKSKILKLGVFTLFGSIFLTACGKSGHTPLPAKGAGSAATEGVATAAIPFSSVLPIFQNRCFRCHNAGPLNWTNQQTLLGVVHNGKFKEKIESGLMPQKGSPEASEMSAEERTKLLAWANAINATPAAPTNSTTPNLPVVTDRNFAFVYQCTACHGQFGTSVSDQFPNLAGHGQDYFLSRLQYFLEPNNQSLMSDQIKRITHDFLVTPQVSSQGKMELTPEASELFKFAATYFSQFLPGPAATVYQTEREKFSPQEKSQYEQGQKVFATRCAACHSSATFQPLPNAPMILGQKLPYLVRRLNEFKSGTGGTVMPALLSTVSSAEIEAVEFYLTHTHPTEVSR